MRRIIAFVLALALTAASVAGVQSQLTLAELAKLGQQITRDDRLTAFLTDLVGFAPLLAALLAVPLLLAFVIAALLARSSVVASLALFPLAGAAAVAGLLAALPLIFGAQPVFAAATPQGIGLLALGGAVGGFAYALLRGRDAPQTGAGS